MANMVNDPDPPVPLLEVQHENSVDSDESLGEVQLSPIIGDEEDSNVDSTMVQHENSVDSDESLSAVQLSPIIGDEVDSDVDSTINDFAPSKNSIPGNLLCPLCNNELTPLYYDLEKRHCQPERQSTLKTEPLRDWMCCNPHCQAEFSMRCKNCPTKLLRWFVEGTNHNKKHWTLHCPDCCAVGRSVKKKARKGACLLYTSPSPRD